MTTRMAPGPPGWPIVGNLPSLAGAEDRIQFLLQLVREYGDVVRVRVGPRETYIVSRPEYAEHVLIDNAANYSKGHAYDKARVFLGEGLFTSEGDLWKRQRRLMQPKFHREQIVQLGQVMELTIGEMIARWQQRPHQQEVLDLAPEMIRLTLEVITRAMFGADVDAAEVSRALTITLEHANSRLLAVFDFTETLPTPENRRAKAALETLDGIVYGIIQQRRQSKEPKADLLQLLLDARDADDNGAMSDQQLRDEVMTIFLAGHETTANALSWGWTLLSTHPTVERRLREEVASVCGRRMPTAADIPRLPYTTWVFQEALRMYPPVMALPREVVRDDEIGGYHIPAGSMVSVSAYLTHHNADVWENPEGFDPERFSPERSMGRHHCAFLGFGAGRRKCIGAAVAMLEGPLVLAMISSVYRPELVPGLPVEMKPMITLRPSRVAVRLRATRPSLIGQIGTT